MADKATQTEWSWLQETSALSLQPPITPGHPECAERVASVGGEGDEQDEGGSDTPAEECPSVGGDHGSGVNKEESGRLSAVRYSDESRLFQTSPEFDELVAMFPDLDIDEEEEERADCSVAEKPPPPAYSLLSSANLPWPAILQYLRESESLSSNYFSYADPPITQPHPQLHSQPHPSSIREIETPPAKHVCPFCGQRAPVFSLLPMPPATEQVRAKDVQLLLVSRAMLHSSSQSSAVRSSRTTVY